MTTHFGSWMLAAILFLGWPPQQGRTEEPQTGPKGPSARPLYSVRDFGAVGDGKTKDTKAIQAAIDAANRAGGGTAYLPPGAYLSGTIFLKDNVALDLEAGATLLGSKDVKDYPYVMPKFRSYTDNYTSQSLIYGEDLHDIAITGRGTIDGQGAAFKWSAYRDRPYGLRFIQCRNVRVEGVSMRNSAMWMQQYLACEDVTIRGISVFNHVTYNNDMIDIDCCRNVRISDCSGDSDDDALTLKSTADRPCEDITVTNCVLRSHCNAIKMGTESNGGFKNVTISNCTVSRSESDTVINGQREGTGGISLMIVDGGTMDRVVISNITITGVRSAIFLRLGNRARPFKKDMAAPGMGTVQNVTLSNIVASGVGTVGCSITGLPGHPVENVTLSDITIAMAGEGTMDDFTRPVPEKAAAYPDAHMFGMLPAYGFYCRHVDGLTLNNVDVRWTKTDRRPVLVCDDVRNLDVNGLSGESAADGAPMIVFNDVVGALLRGCLAPPNTTAFLRLQGKTDEVTAIGNDLRQAENGFEFGRRTPASALFQFANRIE